MSQQSVINFIETRSDIALDDPFEPQFEVRWPTAQGAEGMVRGSGYPFNAGQFEYDHRYLVVIQFLDH
jgi:hypothetical protein